jgi:hypothetical protein
MTPSFFQIITPKKKTVQSRNAFEDTAFEPNV